MITTHDGFTLRDLVSYDVKHNEANGEDGRDGTDDNRAWNCGVEGPSTDPAVIALRGRQSRAFLATLLLSLGVPMLVGGDELGRSQNGNNNAYCQDNPISWFDWHDVDEDLLDYTAAVIALRRGHPALRRRRYLSGARPGEVAWFTPAGAPMTGANWRDPASRAVVLLVDGSAEPDRDPAGRPITDDDLLLLDNGWWEPLAFVLPPVPPRPPSQSTPGALGWRLELDTFSGAVVPSDVAVYPAGASVTVGPRSLVLLASQRGASRPG